MRTLLLCATLGTTHPATAVSLGEVQTNSHIGDVLQLRIPVSVAPDEVLTSDCIRLEGPRTEGVDDFPWLRAGRIRLSTQADGRQVLLVTSAQSIQSPVILLAVRIDCGATLRREYTLLLNPSPANEVTASTAPITPPSRATSPAPDNTSATLRSAKGESLRSLASGLFPTDKTLQKRYIGLLRKRNPVALQGLGDGSSLPLGTELISPDARELSAAPEVTEIATAPKRPSRQTAPESGETNPAAPKKSAGAVSRQRLVLSGSDRSGLQLATGLSGRKELSEKDREKLRTELQLIATLDDKIATQLELSEKLRQLESLQVQLQSDVQSLESRIRQQQALLQPNLNTSAPLEVSANVSATDNTKASPATTTPAVTKNPTASKPPAPSGTNSNWPDWLLPAGGLLALLIVLAGWLRYRNRPIEVLEIAPLTSETEPAQDPADDLFEPLSEEDIWPDAATLKRAPGMHTGTDLPGLVDIGPPSVLHLLDDVAEHDSAVELADIMMSFGRVQGAAQTLADFIRANPKQAVKPWVKLLEVYKVANMRPEFEALTAQLNKTFNVKSVTWDDFDVAMRAPESLEHIPHLTKTLCETWGKRECQAFLHGLLRDNRQGTRQGFPMAMVDEILLLMAILETHLGAYKHDVAPNEPSLATLTARTLTAPDSPQQKSTATAKPELNSSDFDLGMDTQDLTQTLHINLDNLPDAAPDPDDTTRTRFEPRRPEEI